MLAMVDWRRPAVVPIRHVETEQLRVPVFFISGSNILGQGLVVRSTQSLKWGSRNYTLQGIKANTLRTVDKGPITEAHPTSSLSHGPCPQDRGEQHRAANQKVTPGE